MSDNDRQIIRNEETVVAGQPEQTTVRQTETESTTGSAYMAAAPAASQGTVQQTTTTSTTPSDQVRSYNVAERVVDPAAEKAAAVNWVNRLIWFIVGLMAALLV